MRWDVVLFVAAILVFIFIFLRVAGRRRRPESFQHDGRTYQRQPDGSFLAGNGMIVTGAMVGILAAAYQAHQAKSSDSGSSWGWGGDGGSSDSDGDCGGGDGGGDGGGGGGGD